MSLRTVIKKAVDITNSITDSLQAEVIHIAWIGQDGDGTPHYGVQKKYKAIVDLREIERRTPDGNMTLTNAYVLFIQPLLRTGIPGRTEPLDPRDKIILPDGSTGIIAAASGFVDSDTGYPYYGEIWLTKYLITLRSGG